MLNQQVTGDRLYGSPRRRSLSSPPSIRGEARTTADAWTGSGGIAFFFAARGGGVQNKRIVLANALSERGFDVACVLPHAVGVGVARPRPRYR